jgi:hypothetical protein
MFDYFPHAKEDLTPQERGAVAAWYQAIGVPVTSRWIQDKLGLCESGALHLVKKLGASLDMNASQDKAILLVRLLWQGGKFSTNEAARLIETQRSSAYQLLAWNISHVLPVALVDGEWQAVWHV